VKPYFSDEHLTVYHGDSRAVMAEMEPESVHCVVTSPPYWGLRDYGEPGQLGLEPTREEYVADMVAVFREVWRVLRSDGTVWLNLGDSYAAARAGAAYGWTNGKTSKRDTETMAAYKSVGLPSGLKPKDLVGIPWRVAFALQADGWYLRSDIIWSKPNPMPESVTDRPTKSHEYLFLLAKSARYYFDADAVAEEAGSVGLNGGAYAPPVQAPSSNARPSVARGGFHGKTEALPGRNAFRAVTERRNLRSVWTVATQPYPGAHFATFPQKLVEPCVKAGCPEGGVVLDPFAGSGTTGLVAQRLGRRAVLIDLSMDYLGQLMDRNAQKPLGLIG
jgi:DNA modification methylase